MTGLQEVGFFRGSFEDTLASVVMFIVLCVLVVVLIFHTIIFVRKYVRNTQRIRAVREKEHMTDMAEVAGDGGAKGGDGDATSRSGSGSGSGSGERGSGETTQSRFIHCPHSQHLASARIGTSVDSR